MSHATSNAQCYLSTFLPSPLLSATGAPTVTHISDMILRRFRTRVLVAVILLGTCLLVSLYYSPNEHILRKVSEPGRLWTLLWTVSEDCPVHKRSSHRLNTGDIYPELDFSVPDNGGMGFWNDDLENRYREIRKNWKDLPLEVS